MMVHVCLPSTEVCIKEGNFRQQSAEVSNEIFIQYCSGGKWYYLCSGGAGWTPTLAAVACRQLGYSDQGTTLFIANLEETRNYEDKYNLQVQTLV